MVSTILYALRAIDRKSQYSNSSLYSFDTLIKELLTKIQVNQNLKEQYDLFYYQILNHQ
jgi:hypothetical protein